MRYMVWVSKLFLLMVIPLGVWSQNALELRWIKPLGDKISSVGFESLSVGDGCFLIPGFITIPDVTFGCAQCDTNGNALLFVTDTDGNKIYSHCYGGNGPNGFVKAHYGQNNSIWAIGYFGPTNGNFPDTTGKSLGVVKFDSNYVPLWYHFYGSRAENDIADFITTSDGGALILANTNYAGGDVPFKYGNDPFNFESYLCKIDGSGNIKWLVVLGGSGNQGGVKIKEEVRDKYTVLVNTNSVDFMLEGLNFDSLNSSPWVLQIDTGGHILSSRVSQNLGNFYCNDYATLPNGQVIFAGGSMPLSDSDFCSPGLGGFDFTLVSTDAAYNRQWCKMMGGSGNDGISYMSVINDSIVAVLGQSESNDGGLIRCAPLQYSSESHGWLGLVNINTEELTWQTSFCSSVNATNYGMVYDSTSQSLYLLVFAGINGDFENVAVNGTTHNTYLLKYSLTTITSVNEVSKINNTLSLSPNPASTTCTLKTDAPNQMSSAIVFDAAGRMVMPLFNNQHLSTFDFNCTTLSTGLYFVTVKDEEGKVGVLKLVKQ